MDEQKTLFQDENRRRKAWDSVADLVVEAHDNAVDHGFYDGVRAVRQAFAGMMPDNVKTVDQDFVLAQIAKVGSELGEAVEVIQKRGIEEQDLLEELGDVVIRVFDLAGALTKPDNFAQVLLWKMEKNRNRPYLHGKFC